MNELRELIFSQSSNLDEYISFSNADGKKWIMPLRNIEVHLCIYQPSSFKGKLVKRMLPYVKENSFVLSKIHATKEKFSLSKALKCEIEKAFESENLSYGFFLGTPGVHQKVVIQVSKNDEILGYCKVTDSQAVYNNFVAEDKVLSELCNRKIERVPQSLCVKHIMNDSIGIFIQTTTKTLKSKVVHELDDRHVSFIMGMCKKTSHTILYDDTAIARDLSYLKDHAGLVVDLLPEVLEIEEQLRSGVQKACFYHGDFTPWNTYTEKNELCVFDWEYAETDYLPMLDIFHFFNQTCYFEHHMMPEDIVRTYVDLKKRGLEDWVNWTGYDADTLYIAYLLSMISRTLQREEILTDTSKASINLWYSTIKKLKSDVVKKSQKRI